MKNPAAFDDGFWSVWIKGFAVLSQATWHLVISHQGPISQNLISAENFSDKHAP
jgi:hypothetical protein